MGLVDGNNHPVSMVAFLNGNTALVEAIYLKQVGVKEVHLVHRRDQLRAEKAYHDEAVEKGVNITKKVHSCKKHSRNDIFLTFVIFFNFLGIPVQITNWRAINFLITLKKKDSFNDFVVFHPKHQSFIEKVR